ncbi:MAG: hypothetical protein KAY24_00715 [Candidatus Eisenbacteria sp.]|nr:hypothetical protein [Candidatus Eisenbacteria bacterium]
MAKLKAPLLSLGASGQLAKTLVASNWKGIKYMREYVVPANPNTVAQQAQRGVFSAAVHAWQNYLTHATIITGWNVAALLAPSPLSGFNAAVSALSLVLSPDPDASFPTVYGDGLGDECLITMKNMNDGGVGDEAGDFIVRAGTDKSSMSDLGTAYNIAAGILTVAVPAGTYYFQTFKILDGVRVARSGLTLATIT